MKVLITCPRAPATLEWVRIMARSGHEVTLADSLTFPIASFAPDIRYVRTPSPRFEYNAYAERMRTLCESHDLIIPTCEDVFYLSTALGDSPSRTKVFAPEHELLLSLHNKFTFARHLNEYAPAPHTRLIRDRRDIRFDGVRSILKPVYSRFGASVIREVTEATVRTIDISVDRPWVQQEHVAGRYLCNYAIINKGHVVRHVVYEPRYLVHDGASTYFIHTLHEGCDRFIRAFAKDTGYHGQVAFDFIESSDGLYTIECNPRATSGLHLITDSIEWDTSPRDLGKQAIGRARVGISILALFGLQRMMRGEFGDLLKDMGNAHDVLQGLPLRAQMLSFAEVIARAKRSGIPLSAATTYDIEYNGSAPEHIRS